MILGPQGLTSGPRGIAGVGASALAKRKRLEALSEECIDFLIGVVRECDEVKHRVAAARCIIEEHRWMVDRIEDAPKLEQLTEMQARALLACDPLLGKLAREQHDAAAIVAEVDDGREDEAE